MRGSAVRVHAPSRIRWVDANAITTDVIELHHATTRFGQLLTASVQDILLEAAICHTNDEQTRWQTEIHARFSPKKATTNAGDVWANRLLNVDEPVNVITPNTPFQHRVHTALAKVAYATTVTYAQLAAHLLMPQATRAVASAVAANRTAVVIPCHRVWRSDGTPGGFRWGTQTKIALCQHEQQQPNRTGP